LKSRRIPTTLERILPVRFGLGELLVLCAVLPAAIGFGVRWWLALPVYYVETKSVDGFLVESLWVRRRDRHEMLYLLVWPDGDRHATFRLKPDGIYLFTNWSKGHPERYWVYVNSRGSGGVRPVVNAPPLTPAEFARIEDTSLWKDHLRPALVYESQQFDRWFIERWDSPPPSRFTSPDTLREWTAEARKKREVSRPGSGKRDESNN